MQNVKDVVKHIKQNNMEQSVVDFIVEQLDVLHRERKENLIDAETYFKHKATLIKEAKEMDIAYNSLNILTESNNKTSKSE